MSGFKPINVNDKVREARMGLIKTEPFYACLLLGLELEEKPADDPKCRTFNINSKRIAYNVKFAAGLSMKTIKVTLHHEILHLVFQHHLRASKILNYNHDRMNIAGDLAINSHLFLEPGFPEDGLVPGRGDYADFPIGLSAEEYYKMLTKQDEENQPQDESNSDSDSSDSDSEESESDSSQEASQSESEESDSEEDSNEEASQEASPSEYDAENEGSEEDSEGSTGSGAGDSEDDEDSDTEGASSGSDEGDSEEETEEATPSTFGDFESCESEEDEAAEEEAVKDMVSRAVAATKMAGGELPSLVETNLDDILGKPKIPWEKVLRNSLSVRKRAGVNWKNPSRRATGGFIMPSRQVKAPGGILFVADASYSMDVEEIKAGLTECQAILDMGAEIEYWEFSTRVTVQKTFTAQDSLEDHRMGPRGGTAFQCVIDKLIEERKRPEIIVVVSDMCLEKLDWSRELKGSTVIWLSTTDRKAVNGKTINIRA